MSAYLREDRASPVTPGFHHSPQSSTERPRPSPHTNSGSTPRDLVTDSNSPAHTVARQDIRASAEKILYTFLLPGAEREIVLPAHIVEDVTRAIEEEGRDDPEVFDLAKDYVFQAMERDAFPGFLRMKALGNLIPPTLILRLIIGLVSMFGGFWAGFVLIFLDKSRLVRLWVGILSKSPDFGRSLTVALAHPALHSGRLFSCLVPIFVGSSSSSDRSERVHPFQFLPCPRAICSQAARETSTHGPSRDGPRRCSLTRTFHPGPRQTALIVHHCRPT